MDILLVEDNPGDIRLMQVVFQEAFPSVRLHVANDGVEAMAFLKREGANAKAPRPALIVLDLNMPKMDGRELLAVIKQSPVLRIIPTVILTTSGAEEDVLAGYSLQASSYLRKPVDFNVLKERIQTIGSYWLCHATLPDRPAFLPGA